MRKMVLITRAIKRCLFTLLFYFLFNQALAQDSVNPVCPPPAPICRSYETPSCEWALNMIPVYVCRTDLVSILGLGTNQGCKQRPQSVVYQPPFTAYNQHQPILYNQPPIQYSEQTVMPTYLSPQPQTIYKTYTTRQPAQYGQFMSGRSLDHESQVSSHNGPSDTASATGISSSRVKTPGLTGDATSSNGQPQSQQMVEHGQKPSGTPGYQGTVQPAATPPQSSYRGGQLLNNERDEVN